MHYHVSALILDRAAFTPLTVVTQLSRDSEKKGCNSQLIDDDNNDDFYLLQLGSQPVAMVSKLSCRNIGKRQYKYRNNTQNDTKTKT